MKNLVAAVFLSVFPVLAYAQINVPLTGKVGKYTYALGLEERMRYEYRYNFDLNPSVKDNGSLFFHRFKINTQLSNDWMTFFIEGLDAQTGGYQLKAISNQTDDFDLHQLYVQLKDIASSHLDVKLGRQEIEYGKGRIIGAPAWNNRMRAFDASILHWANEGFYADAFYAQDVKYDDDKFNASRNEEFVTGLYGGYQHDKKSPLLETYLMKLVDIKGNNDINRYTVGARVQAEVYKGIVADVEVPFQFGKTGTQTGGAKTIKAWAFHADLSKAFEDIVWKPKVALAYDQASGDNDPNDSVSNTFVPLYQASHSAYGLLDFVRWQNVRNPELGITFNPTKKFKFTTMVDFFWLDSKSDAWYNSTGSTVRLKTAGERDYYLGRELSLRLYYDFNKNVKWENGVAHFSPGSYAADSGANHEAFWVYSQLSIKY